MKPRHDHKMIERRAPGPTGCPVLGSLPPLAWNLLRFFESVSKRYGDIVRIKLGRKTVTLIRHPRDLSTLFADERKGHYRRQFFHDAYEPAFGDGIFNSDGETWARQRQILQPYFNKQAVAAWFPVIREEAERALHTLAGQSPNTIQIEPQMLPLVQTILCRILFGQPLNDTDSRHAVAAINTISRHIPVRSMQSLLFKGLFNRLPTPGNRRFEKALVVVDQALSNLQRKASKAQDSRCLLTQLAPHFQARELRDHLFTLFFGGQDTTVNAIAFTLYYLGRDPDLQQQAREEVMSVLGGNGQLALDQLPQLRLTESVIDESMRLAPPAYASYRDVVGDQTLGGLLVRDQSLVVFSPYLTHRHPALWEEPERFNPKRFLNDTVVEKFALMPYGGGKHTCLGVNLARMEILIVVALFLQRFQWTVPQSYQLKPVAHMTLKARSSIPITLVSVS